MNKRRVVFLYPSNNVGGVELLFYRLAVRLVELGVRVGVVDYKKGFLAESLSGLDVDLLEVKEGELHMLSRSDVLVCPLSYIFIFNNYLKLDKNTTLFFWDLHPNNLVENTAFSFLYKRITNQAIIFLLKSIERVRVNEIKRLVTSLNRLGSICFMCKSNFEHNRLFFDFAFHPAYLPIPMLVSGCPAKEDLKSIGELNLGWVSRIDKDKINAINNFISDASDYAHSNDSLKIKVHLIGDGDSMSEVVRPENLSLEFPGRMEFSRLDEYVNDNLDIGFSIGTSALELATRGVPTALLPGKELHSQVRANKYLPIYMAKDFELSIEPNLDSDKIEDFGSLLDLFLKNLTLASRLSQAYVADNHSFEIVANKFVGIIDAAAYRYDNYVLDCQSGGGYLYKGSLAAKKFIKDIYSKHFV